MMAHDQIAPGQSFWQVAHLGIPDAAAEAPSQHPEGRDLQRLKELSLQVPWQRQDLHVP